MDSPNLDLRELTPGLWPALEKLLGPNGACGGCWCMFWRLPKGERYDDVKGPRAKARFKTLVKRGKVHYPVKLGQRLPAAFAYTGVTSMFDACGFAVAEVRPKGKQRYRKVLQTVPARRRGDLRD